MSKRKLPEHISGTHRAWKARKRRELAEAEQALRRFLMGCAYTPSRGVGTALEWFREQRQALSAKKWGR